MEHLIEILKHGEYVNPLRSFIYTAGSVTGMSSDLRQAGDSFFFI